MKNYLFIIAVRNAGETRSNTFEYWVRNAPNWAEAVKTAVAKCESPGRYIVAVTFVREEPAQ